MASSAAPSPRSSARLLALLVVRAVEELDEGSPTSAASPFCCRRLLPATGAGGRALLDAVRRAALRPARVDGGRAGAAGCS